MAIRILTSIVGILLILYALLFNYYFLYFLVLLVVSSISYELVKMRAHITGKPVNYIPILGSLLFFVFYFTQNAYWTELTLSMMLLAAGLAVVFSYPNIDLNDILFGFFVGIYGGWAVMHILVLFAAVSGGRLLVLVLVAVWCCDTGAYFTGRFLGKHKLAPHLSPKKTIEGAIGGVFVAIIGVLVFNYFVGVFASLPSLIFFAVITAIGGIIGDLFESYLKRVCHVKDTGHILPGHGGFLDRFDSFLFVAPICSYLLPIFTAVL